MPYKPNGSAVIMHKLRDYRTRQGLTAREMANLLERYGARNVRRYGTKERCSQGWQMADSTEFRLAARAVLGERMETLAVGHLPNPCNYCHRPGTYQVCGACGRNPEERNI